MTINFASRMRGVFILALLLSVLTAAGYAQIAGGSIVGNVTDQSGGALVNARVVATNVQTNQKSETVTNGLVITQIFSLP
ncbi:MAG: carboxypeptidase-like regulatory domain-containing protein [Blastocatellia bacterium]